MFKHFKEDIQTIKDRDPAARSYLEVFLCYPGLYAILNHRTAHWFYKHKMFLIARIISQISRFFTGVEIHPGAVIGRRLFIDHGMGVVIGETSEIGDDVTLYQGVTLGGTGKDTGKRHPTIGNNVTIGSGAKILGPISVGHNVKVGACAVVVRCIAPNSTAVGVPSHSVVRDPSEFDDIDLAHNNMPDPLEEEIAVLRKRLDNLEKLYRVS